MTTLLFRLDPYLKEFDAVVTKLGEGSVVLDKTCFYPQGGGQVGDTGVLSECRVANTIMAEGEIHHILAESKAFTIGQIVHGVIDWERRYRIMRLHSAAHLVYYVMKDVFGVDCRPASSGLLDELKDRSDYLFDEPLDKAKLARVEEKVNQLIAESHSIRHRADETSGGRLEWGIENYPTMECGGTHVKNTSEIGRVSIKRGSKPGKGRERIELKLQE